MGDIDHFGNVEMNHFLIAKALSVCVCVCVCVRARARARENRCFLTVSL